MNRHPARKRHIIATALVVLSIVLLHLGLFLTGNRKERVPLERLSCVLDIKEYDDTTRGLVNGYNYALLKGFALEYGIDVCDITIAGKDDSLLDSLRNGAVDIAVIPVSELAEPEDIIIGGPDDSLVVWAIRPDLAGLAEDLAGWLPKHTDSLARDKYFNTFNNPLKVARYGIKREFLSPYDSLFKAYAPQLGWDWRLLAAVAWQESRFHIEAHSHRGAFGLMQMMPGTAEFLSVENLVDPENSIRAGVEYLAWLGRIFRRKSLDRTELVRFTLAAYNAGQGRIKDCINYAQYKGIYDSTWNCIAEIIPEMSNDSILLVDTVKLGKFKGRETISYVENVMAIYEAFRQIVPFSPDQPSK